MMPRYFFHTYDGHALSKDEEGTEYYVLGDAVAAARQHARNQLADLIRDGKNVEAFMFYVGNEDGFTEAQFTAAELLGFQPILAPKA